MADDRIDVLNAVPLLKGLGRRERKLVASAMRERWFNAGEDIVAEGEPGAGFYLLAEGTAKVLRNGREVRTLGPNTYFGEMAVIDGAPRSATVRAETRTRAYSISTWDFLTLLEENWDITRSVMVELCRRVREADGSDTA